METAEKGGDRSMRRTALRRGRIIPETDADGRGSRERSGAPGRSGASSIRRWRTLRLPSRPGLVRNSTAKSAHHVLAAAELSEEFLHRSRQRGFIQAIDDILSLALVDDQIGFLEDRQVTGDRGLRQIEIADDLSHRALVALEQPQDLLPCAVRQRLEHLGQMPFLTP